MFVVITIFRSFMSDCLFFRLRRTVLSFVACPFSFKQVVSLLYRCFVYVLAVLSYSKVLCAFKNFLFKYFSQVLLETLCGCDIQVSGDVILANETSLIVMNHRTRTDWNFLWPTMYHCVYGKSRFRHPTKFVLKDIIRHIPGPGTAIFNYH